MIIRTKAKIYKILSTIAGLTAGVGLGVGIYGIAMMIFRYNTFEPKLVLVDGELVMQQYWKMGIGGIISITCLVVGVISFILYIVLARLYKQKHKRELQEPNPHLYDPKQVA